MHVPPWWFWIGAVALAQIAAFSTSIYLHRALTHSSVRASWAADIAFRAILWLTTGQLRREWVAVHRKHHAFTDQEGDPHSPRLVGFWRVFFGNVLYYIRAAHEPGIMERFAPDIKDDVLEKFLFSTGRLGPILGTVVLVIFAGFWGGLAIAILHGFLYVFVLAPLINAVGHWKGQQNFENSARNSRLLALVTAGESLHNNHHAHPRSPKFSMRRGEFDPSWPVIRLLASMGLVTVTGSPVLIK